MTVLDVFEYLDYREYLRAFYEQEKTTKKHISYRYLASRLGVDAGYLVKVLQGVRHFAPDLMHSAALLCRLQGREAEYFIGLLAFTKARSNREIKVQFDLLMKLKGIDIQEITQAQEEYYSKWYHPVIRSLLGITAIRDEYEKLAKLVFPSLKVAEAEQSVMLLHKLGMIQRDASQTWKLSSRFVASRFSLTPNSIHKYQIDMMQKASESLSTVPVVQRNISCVTMALNSSQFQILSEQVDEFRQQLLRMAQAETLSDCIYQLNVQLFPVSSIAGEKP